MRLRVPFSDSGFAVRLYSPVAARVCCSGVFLAVACCLLLEGFTPCAAFAQKTEPRRDQFGLVPEDKGDKDLLLPDRVLDREWPGTPPGAGNQPVPNVAPDEEETNPFDDYAPPAPPSPPAKPQDDEAEDSAPPPRPPVGPDGRYDVGSPQPEADPDAADVLGYDGHDPSEMETEENLPSPLDVDDYEFDQEAADPEEW